MTHNEKLAEKAKFRRKYILDMYNRGWRVSVIASAYGISKQRVSQLLKRARSEA